MEVDSESAWSRLLFKPFKQRLLGSCGSRMRISRAQRVVYSSFLVGAAREAGVDVDRLVRLPLVTRDLKKDVSVQVSLPCPDCVALEQSMSEDMVGEDFSFSVSEIEGNSQRQD